MMSYLGVPAAWLPAVLAVILTALAFLAVAAPASAATGRRWQLAGIVVLGALTVLTTARQAWTGHQEIARLARDSHSTAVAVASLENKVAELKASTRARSLGAGAAKLADYLRPFGRREVVVSCTPGDIEAYQYATEITDALKAAGWAASGPEPTTIFGDIRAMGVNIYDNGGRGSDTAKILVGAFTKLGIPYQSRVPPSDSAPADQATELFIGAKPGSAAMAAATTVH